MSLEFCHLEWDGRRCVIVSCPAAIGLKHPGGDSPPDQILVEWIVIGWEPEALGSTDLSANHGSVASLKVYKRGTDPDFGADTAGTPWHHHHPEGPMTLLVLGAD